MNLNNTSLAAVAWQHRIPSSVPTHQNGCEQHGQQCSQINSWLFRMPLNDFSIHFRGNLASNWKIIRNELKTWKRNRLYQFQTETCGPHLMSKPVTAVGWVHELRHDLFTRFKSFSNSTCTNFSSETFIFNEQINRMRPLNTKFHINQCTCLET
jgi:hypothetical protein